MQRFLGVIVGLGCCLTAAAEEKPQPLVTGLKRPTAVVAWDGRVYVADRSELGKTGDGRILVLEGGKAVPFVTGLNHPMGLAAYNEWLFATDEKRVWRIDKKGKITEFVAEQAFPVPPQGLSPVTVDEQGNLYVTDVAGGALFRIDPKGKVTLLTDAKRTPGLMAAPGLVMDGLSFLLVGNVRGELHRIKIADGGSVKVAEGLGSATSLAWDHHGCLYVGGMLNGKVHVIRRPGEDPVLLASGLGGVADIGLDPTGKFLLVSDIDNGTVKVIPARVPGKEVDESPLPLETAVAFPDLKWEGWEPTTPQGKLNPLRLILLTHAGDGSNRVFAATEQGVIHVFPNDQKAAKTKVFLDLRDRVKYDDKENEEGFLGLAFHPRYKENGEFFVFYTTKKAKLTNIVSRFRVSKDDPDRADPASEEVLLTIEKPYWNHDGGTLCFGPDGYLYLTHGDGGLANDPKKNGQNLKTLLGKVLRIDVDHKDAGKNYAVPKDNPFAGREDAAGEIWAYGLRNVWRMSFDRKTGALWAGDVGQNLYEEIDLIVKGGNYGWSRREGLHPFGADGADAGKDFIEPIWEYDHVVGKCIIGGHVYRGSLLPELDGHYLYADYVTNRLWALRYDEDNKRVTANRTLKAPGIAVLSFGEDEKGEVYLVAEAANGKGIYRIVRSKEGEK